MSRLFRGRSKPGLTLRGVVVVVAGAAALLAFFAYFFGRQNGFPIEAERASRRFDYTLGRPLPGSPALGDLDSRLAAQGFARGAPMLIRVFKAEFELEVWLLRGRRFERFATYPICRWSGWLGPKIREGDRQAPEGFYAVDRAALNPNSRWHRSFNVGFPNAFDRHHGRTGSFLMIHGGCSSVGCFAMTDPVIDEIWQVLTAALAGRQPRVPVQIFPFRLTDRNLAAAGVALSSAGGAASGSRPDTPATSGHGAFWADLKAGYDLFEETFLPPRVALCRGRYQFRRANTVGDSWAVMQPKCFASPSLAGRT